LRITLATAAVIADKAALKAHTTSASELRRLDHRWRWRFWINQGGADKNFWFSGVLLQRKVTDKLTVGGEIFHQTADSIDSHDSTGFNVGAVYDINEHNHFLFSAGRGLQNASDTNVFSWYVGYLITGP
jgi:hypothetical protein